MTRRFLVPFVALALTGCARDATVYPSLSPRAVEKLGFAEPEAPLPGPVQPDPALDARIAALDGRLTAAAKDFAADRAVAERLTAAAAGRSVGSDAWLDGQAALATLDGRRADTSALLGDADALLSARAEQLEPPYPALGALRERIEAEAIRQSEAIARLQALLPGA